MSDSLRRWLVAGFVFCLIAVPGGPAAGVDIFVAPGGNDARRGTRRRPFATLQRARDAARSVPRTEPVNIWIRGGTYYLDKPLVIGMRDSGTKRAPISYRAFPGERPTISGGVRLQLVWRPETEGVMAAHVPRTAGGGPAIDQLFVDGVPQRMARFPNFAPKARFFGGTSPEAVAPERVKKWSRPDGGFLHALHKEKWGSKHYRITGVDHNGKLTLTGGWQENRAGGWDEVFRGGYHPELLFVENIYEELDAPGEWFFDRQDSILYLKPAAGVDLAKAEVIAAGLKQLIVFKGRIDAPIRYVHFRGLSLRHTARVFMEPYERLLRGDWSIARLAAVYIEGAEDCSVADCNFEDLGGNGVLISRYNRRVTVEGCRFVRLGESAVCLVGSRDAVRTPAISYEKTLPRDEIDLTPGPKSSHYPANCKIHNNLMHTLGQVGKQTAGVLISMSQEITVSHNTIYNVPRAAICINDGCWGGHVIEHNDAFNTVIETGDHGPFNSWGRDRYWRTEHNPRAFLDKSLETKRRALLDAWKTTHIRGNRFSHPGGNSWGIDLDDGSTNYRVYNNLCLGMGVKLREGFDRRVENNIIFQGFGGFHIWFPGCDDVITRNIIVHRKPYQFIRANPHNARQFDHNLLFNRDGMPRITGFGEEMTFTEWQDKGFDTHSLAVDPLFVDPEKGDWRVKPESAALTVGFKNFPMDRFGVLKPRFQAEVRKVPRKYRPFPTIAVPPPKRR